METAKGDMRAEVKKAKEDFIAHYQTARNRWPDSLDNRTLQELEFSIISTDSYLDSLKREMDELDEMDAHNVNLVKTTFLYKGAGDSIINKLRRSIAASQNAARTEQQKFAIKAASDSLFFETSDRWKEQMFGLTNPLGASMIIYGLQTELYKIGMIPLSDK